jgi:hypothetical protein
MVNSCTGLSLKGMSSSAQFHSAVCFLAGLAEQFEVPAGAFIGNEGPWLAVDGSGTGLFTSGRSSSSPSSEDYALPGFVAIEQKYQVKMT